MVDEISFASSLELHLNIKVDEEKIGQDLKITIYRIIQEQINNILKHAQATIVSVQLSVDNEKLVILTTDNGSGFDLSAAKQGVGLTNMISRVEMFNGEIKIDTLPGQGCVIKIKLPLDGV